MLFVVIATDRADTAALRQATRAAHLDWIAAYKDRVRLAGPFVTEDGKAMTGSMLIFEGESLAEIKALVAQDPYNRAGLFEAVEVRPWAWTVKNPDAA